MIRYPAALLAGLLLALATTVLALSRGALTPPGEGELMAHVAALAAPEMEGRGSGTPGGERAARYIADRLASIGLQPGGEGGTFFQHFVVTPGTRVGPGSMLDRLGPAPRSFAVGSDWSPHGGSAPGEVSGLVVFVGYGITAPDSAYDDYAGADVRGRIAVALDGAPGHLAGLGVSRLEKLINARRRGARALLIAGDGLPLLGATGAPVSLVSGALTRQALDELLAPAGRSTSELARALSDSQAPISFATGIELRIRVELEREDRRAANVLGILPGRDPPLAAEAVVVGAHYDHLGRIGGLVHPGADDNASGTAVVLGLARAFAAAGRAPRTLIFALFSGEEIGLVGSGHYVHHPMFPLERTVAMVNFDMVGRMRDRRLSIGGVESAAGLRALVTGAAADHGLTLNLHGPPFSPSDHTRFYSAGVPVLFFHTDGHEDYHRPTDTADRINAAGLAQVGALAAGVVQRLSDGPHLAYVRLTPGPSTRRASGLAGGAFLGIAPDLRVASDGLRLGAVVPGGAAERAGMRDGDVIVRFGSAAVNSFDDLRSALQVMKPGDTVTVVFLRDGQDHATRATVGARP